MPESPVRRRLGPLAVVGAVLVAALALVPATSASAHDYLVDSTPIADSTVDVPLAEVTLTFNAPVIDLTGDGAGAIVQITGPDDEQRHFETGCSTILDRTVTVPVTLGGPGRYTITWRVVSADGHPVSDSIAFTYRPTDAGTTPAAGSASSDCDLLPAETGVATPVAAESGQPGDSFQLVIGVAIAIAVFTAMGVIVLVTTSRRKPASGD